MLAAVFALSLPDLTEHSLFAWAGILSLLITLALVFFEKIAELIRKVWTAFKADVLDVVDFYFEVRARIRKARAAEAAESP